MCEFHNSMRTIKPLLFTSAWGMRMAGFHRSSASTKDFLHVPELREGEIWLSSPATWKAQSRAFWTLICPLLMVQGWWYSLRESGRVYHCLQVGYEESWSCLGWMGARERGASPCIHTGDPWVPRSQDYLYLCRCSLWLQVEERSSSFQLIWKSGHEHRSWAGAHTLAKSSGLASLLQLLWSLPHHPGCAGFAWVEWILPTGVVFVFGDDQTSFSGKGCSLEALQLYS